MLPQVWDLGAVTSYGTNLPREEIYSPLLPIENPHQLTS